MPASTANCWTLILWLVNERATVPVLRPVLYGLLRGSALASDLTPYRLWAAFVRPIFFRPVKKD